MTPEKMTQRLAPVMLQVAYLLESSELKPSKRLRCSRYLENAKQDRKDLAQVMPQGHLRIHDATPVKAKEKALSGADRDTALMFADGQR